MSKTNSVRLGRLKFHLNSWVLLIFFVLMSSTFVRAGEKEPVFLDGKTRKFVDIKEAQRIEALKRSGANPSGTKNYILGPPLSPSPASLKNSAPRSLPPSPPPSPAKIKNSKLEVN